MRPSNCKYDMKRYAFLILLCSAVFSTSALAAETVTVSDQSWALICDEQSHCQMVYKYEAGAQPAFSISIEFIKSPNTKQPLALAIITAPMNVLLHAGIDLKPNRARSMRVAYRSCHADILHNQKQVKTSCIAPFQITKNLENIFKRGADFSLTANGLDGKLIKQEFSLFGFTKIFNALKNKQ